MTRSDAPARPRRFDAALHRRRATSGKDASRVPALLRDAVGLCWRSGRRQLSTLLLLQVVVGLSAAGQVLLTKVALGRLIGAPAAEVLDRALAPLAGLVLLAALTRLCAAITTQLQRLLGERVARTSWRELIGVTTRVPLETFEDDAFYDQLQRVQTSALQQPLAVSTGLISLVSGAVSAVGVILALLVIQPLLVPVLLLGTAPAYLLQRRSGKLEYDFAYQQTPRMRVRYALSEVLSDRASAKEVRAFELGGELARRHHALYDDYVDALTGFTRRLTRLQVLSTLSTALVTAAALLLLLVLVQQGRVSLSSAAAAVAAVAFLASAASSLSAGAGRLVRAALYLEDLADFNARLEDPVLGEASTPVPREDALVFDVLSARGVSYTYPGEQEPALRDVDLELRRGEVLALVGENGSGKTTLSKVLAGLYPPRAGALLWDGQDVRDLDQAGLRSGTAVLFQDFVHYELSLRDNVALGRPGKHHQSDVERAAAAAGADRVVDRLKDGWDTFLSPRFPGGVDLSGGQWQRVAMARVLLRDAPFVVLDEPTAALDARAEADLFAAIRQVLAGRTVVLVSHRFSSVRLADRIVVLHEGRVVEQGHHESLMAEQGRYWEMYSLQARAFGVEDETVRPA